MSEKTNYSLLIDRFLSGEMNKQECLDFQQQVERLPELARELQLERDIISSLEDQDVVAFRKKLIQINSERKQPVTEMKTKTAFYKEKWYLIAATAAVLILLGGSLSVLVPRSYSNQHLFKMYYSSDNTLEVTRSGNANLVEAIREFQQKDFDAAGELFSDILREDGSNIAIRFYAGIASIETGKIDNAISSFKYIINDDNNLYIEHAQWYLGLCYLRNDQSDKAISQFHEIAENPNSYYKAEALKILEKVQVD